MISGKKFKINEWNQNYLTLGGWTTSNQWFKNW